MSLQVGQQAPDFILYNTEKKQVTLSEQRGQNVLLLFFPFAFTSVCTAELCSVRDNFKVYENLKAKPFGISVDSLYSLKKYKEEQALNFDLLSDFNKEASEAYNVLYQKFSYGMLGVSKRAAFVLDQSGIIRYAEVLENASLQPNFGAIKQTLTAIQV
jgi:peroxiredoxin